MDWEQWLRSSAARPSDHEDSKRELTEQQIKNALKGYEPLHGRPYRVYAKGSYANNTNVRLNYDVDIAVEYTGFFFYDLCFGLEGEPKETVGIVASVDPYTIHEFKTDVRGALVAAFGASAVASGRIAQRVREKKTTLPADVVPCWEYRRFDGIENGVPVLQKGACVFPTGGSRTPNYPEQQLSNGVAKNLQTSKRYKRMVRALKRLQTLLVSEGKLDKELPSYLIECLVYNVPNLGFGGDTYRADMRHVLASVFNSTLTADGCSEWVEVNNLKYLFKGTNAWTSAEVHRLADAAWNRLGYA